MPVSAALEQQVRELASTHAGVAYILNEYPHKWFANTEYGEQVATVHIPGAMCAWYLHNRQQEGEFLLRMLYRLETTKIAMWDDPLKKILKRTLLPEHAEVLQKALDKPVFRTSQRENVLATLEEAAKNPIPGICNFCALPSIIENLTGGEIFPPLIQWILENGFEFAEQKQATMIKLFNAGNWIPEEIPTDLMSHAFLLARNHPTVQEVLVEMRSAYLTEELLDGFRRNLGDKSLTIAIGLESSNPEIRNGPQMRKGESVHGFENAVVRAYSRGVKIQAYCFLKPVALSEAAAIEDTVRTIQYCDSVGVKIASISAAYIPEYARPIALQYERGEFRPPWIRSVIEVLQRTYGKLSNCTVRLNQFDEGIQLPANWKSADPRSHEICECTFAANAALEAFRFDGDLRHFDNLPTSCCKAHWEQELTAG